MFRHGWLLCWGALAVCCSAGEAPKTGGEPLKPVITAEAVFFEQALRTLRGNENTWYVLSLQETSGNVKRRGHNVTQGKENAARMIAQFMAGGPPKTRKFMWEGFPTQAAAEAKNAAWREYDRRAGYR